MGIINDIPGVATIKLFIAGIVLVALIVGGFYIHSQWTDYQVMKANYTTLKSNNQTLTQNMASCVRSNKTDQDTIASLLNERSQDQIAIDLLSAQKKAVTDQTALLERQLKNLNKDPKNNGPVAPVLRETIRTIQQEGGQ